MWEPRLGNNKRVVFFFGLLLVRIDPGKIDDLSTFQHDLDIKILTMKFRMPGFRRGGMGYGDCVKPVFTHRLKFTVILSLQRFKAVFRPGKQRVQRGW